MCVCVCLLVVYGTLPPTKHVTQSVSTRVLFYRTIFFRFAECVISTFMVPQYLPIPVEKTIATAQVTSRLDYCNSLFHNIAIQDIKKVHVQNCLGL